jgi:acyl-CoA reductase-like NAD-dependent aldehyde dehydrogenase
MSAHPAELADIRTDVSLLIDGTASSSLSSLDVINPATGRVCARCPAAGRDELDRAVASARRAFPSCAICPMPSVPIASAPSANR